NRPARWMENELHVDHAMLGKPKRGWNPYFYPAYGQWTIYGLYHEYMFFNSHDREFHVASLPYKPDFKVMPEDWDGTTRDPDEVLYEISMKEDKMLYEEFVQRLEFNKKK
ncbi:hypothetical protein ACJX0J_017884, partial [Zea mays]